MAVVDGSGMGQVEALLREAKDRGVAVVFLPDEEGWEIAYGFLSGTWPGAEDWQLGCGRLSLAHDLETAASAAFRPLSEIADSYERVILKKKS